VSALEGRRAKALDDYFDAGGHTSERVERAIESATRVQITGGVFDAAYRAYDDNGDPHSSAIGAAVRAAFEAAGFEVTQ
jgi:hypothetical protein